MGPNIMSLYIPCFSIFFPLLQYVLSFIIILCPPHETNKFNHQYIPHVFSKIKSHEFQFLTWCQTKSVMPMCRSTYHNCRRWRRMKQSPCQNIQRKYKSTSPITTNCLCSCLAWVWKEHKLFKNDIEWRCWKWSI